ncbi:ABC transporter permease [Roseivirga sp. E12]|uniref:ABC transporter permease n=1 Tax=Roseivirga sp. E12 TaxID=2819237 RepID=UPI001ABC99F0|nr:ABC transporter permease [Roseivirga sp. E12]
MSRGKDHITPPRLAEKLLLWFLKDELAEEVLGDLEEKFKDILKTNGLRKANRNYCYQVFKYLRPFALKRIRSKRINNTMYINHTKVALRSLSRNKLFTFINITGMAIGMSVALLIINLVFDALKFDQFHTKKDRIYRVLSTPKHIGHAWDENATAPAPLASFLETDIPGIEEVVRIRRRFSGRVKKEDGSLFAQGIYADDSFFKVFSFGLLQGNPETALQNPYDLVLTQTLAEKLRPGEDLMGQVLTIPDRGEFLVTGIVEDPPAHSHMKFELITSFKTVKPLEEKELIFASSENWEDFNTSYVYFLVKDTEQIMAVENRLNEMSISQYASNERLEVSFSTQNITSIVPGKDLNNQIGAELIPLPIIILSIIAIAIVLSACFNYTNLSIARAMRRSKEIGVRKIVGSSKSQIFIQFSVETVVMTILSVFFSTLLFLVIKPLFITSIPRIDLIMEFNTSPVLMLYFLLFAVVIGLVSGLFPALFFSRLKPLNALRSNGSIRLFSHIKVRKALIVLQFSLSVLFLIAMNVVFKQYRYAMAYDMGFKEENILNLSLNGNDHERLIAELEKIPEISQLSGSSAVPGTTASNTTMVKSSNGVDSVRVNFLSVNPNFMDIHNLKLISGEVYPANQQNEILNKMLVNEEFAHVHGYNEVNDIIGEVFYMNQSLLTVTGVLEDFNFQTIEEPIRPLILFDSPSNYEFLNLNVQASDLPNVFDKIEKAWTAVDEETELELKFLDQELEESNAFLMIFVRVFGFLGLVAVSIACLGLLGMAVFTAETRVKEIGIRKAIGASVNQLIYTLSKSYLFLIIISGFVGGTLAYILLQKVILPEIHHHVNVGFFEFAIAIGMLFLLALLAIGSQTWRAASRNPSESLRSE